MQTVSRRRWLRPQMIGWVLAVGVAMSAVWVATPRLSAWISRSPLFVVKSIRLQMPPGADTATIVALSGIKSGMHLTEVRPRQIVRDLSSLGWVLRVQVRRKLPDAVEITLVERQPIAFLSLGRLYAVDREGVVFIPLPTMAADIPLFFGATDTTRDPKGRLRLTKTGISTIKSFLHDLEAAPGDLEKHTAQIDLSDPREARLVCNSGHTTVLLNRAVAPYALARLGRLLEFLAPYSLPPPRRVDLRHGNLAFVQEGTK